MSDSTTQEQRAVQSATNKKNKKHYTKGFSAIFSTGSANPAYTGRYKPVTIIGVTVWDKPIDRAQFIQRFKERVLPKYPRFRSVARPQAGERMAFEEVPIDGMNWDYHVRIEPSKPPRGAPWSQELLNEFLSDLYNGTKDPAHPLFQWHLVDCMADGTSVVVMSIDHAIGDGISMVSMLMSLFDEALEEPPGGPTVQKRPVRPTVLQCLYGVRILCQYPDLPKIVCRFRCPGRARNEPSARPQVAHGAAMALAMPLLPADPPSRLKLDPPLPPFPPVLTGHALSLLPY